MAKGPTPAAKLHRAAMQQYRRIKQHWTDYQTIPPLRVLHYQTAAFIRSVGLNPKDYLIGDQHTLKYKRGLSEDAREGRRKDAKRSYYRREEDKLRRHDD